nr:MAG TPA: hypothetical protein [Caudoviricetes sp.]
MHCECNSKCCLNNYIKMFIRKFLGLVHGN